MISDLWTSDAYRIYPAGLAALNQVISTLPYVGVCFFFLLEVRIRIILALVEHTHLAISYLYKKVLSTGTPSNSIRIKH